MELKKYIDHTLLKPDATYADIEKLCREAAENDFFAVCVNSCWVAEAKELLAGTDVKVASVVGFPLGACATAAKVAETTIACLAGASEIDMVINIGYLLGERYDDCLSDICQVCDAAHRYGAIVKVIIETCLLTDEQIVKACEFSLEADAEYVKTSTGFSTGGATVEAVSLMKRTVGDYAKVKASGGIRDRETAMKMILAGADRLGTSSGVKIISG